MRKKFLSLVLALCMVISLLPMTAFAAKLTSLTVSTAAKNTAESGKVMLTITSEGTPEENGALLYQD